MNKKVYTYDDRDFFEKRIDENYYLVLMRWELKQLEQYQSVKGKKIVFNDFKELESLKSDTIRDNDLYVIAVGPDKVYIYDVEKDEEKKYRIPNNQWIIAYKWLGFGQYRCYTVSGDCYVGNPRDGWVLEKEAV